MSSTSVPPRLERLKRKAKQISREQGISHSAALDVQARRHGYEGWALFVRAGRRQQTDSASLAGLTAVQFRRALEGYIKRLDPGCVRTLCNGGSIWVSSAHVLAGRICRESFRVLGSANDQAQRKFASELGLLLAVEYAGLGDAFVFPDVDDDPQPPDPWQERYSTEAGRANLLQLLDCGYEGDFDGLRQRIDSLIDPACD